MEKIKNIEELKVAIRELENEKLLKQLLLKEQFITICESLKPINILKDTLKEAQADPALKTTVINNAIGFVSGAAIRKIVTGKSHNPLRNLVGMVLERLVAKNAEGIRTVADNILEKIINHQKNTENVL
jgi:hypothetical protein